MLRPLIDGELVTEGKILEDEVSSLPRQQPRHREPQPKPEPHVRTLLNGECRKLQRAQLLGGSSFRAPQVVHEPGIEIRGE